MFKFKKLISLLLIICSISFFMVACGDSESKSTDDGKKTEVKEDEKVEEVKYKDTIVMVTNYEADTLDPRRGNSAQNNIPLGLIFENLIYVTPDGKYEPGLAESYELEDSTHLRIKLREGVKFSNGEELTTEDVFYCLERTLHDSTSKSTMIWFDPEGTVIEDDYNMVIAMHEPYSPYEYVLSGGRTYIGNKKTMEEMGEEDHARSPVGTGPYVLKNWEVGSKMEFTANPNWWQGKAATENLILRVVPEASSRVIELETKQADFAFYIEGSDVGRVDELDGYHVEQKPSARYFLVTLSMEEELFKDQRVREALSLAIDNEALVNSTLDGIGIKLTGIYSPIVFGFKDYGEDYMPYDVEKAKELMKEAGYEDGFEIEMQVNPTTQFEKMAEVVQAMWSRINVRVNIVPVALATYEAQHSGQWQASIRDGNAFEVSNILIIYEKQFGSRLQPNDDYLDSMLQKYKTVYDEKEQLELLDEIQQYIYDKRYSIPFAYVPQVYGVSDKLENVQISDTPYLMNFAEWKVRE